ncbi:hypothetical protein DQ04_03361040 [Trypanosoma grayi]|uniref:hypothetical protein n=1 Tax=Trypanosoma grayi TaxID=71804 RepID=UPI0004F43402|nr:hypothetical protein DQ04_03361040 [Trypanosoma grayi]KEG10732.1 hypothetical protein DQ04_03361040 [Trypanosoma grayi]
MPTLALPAIPPPPQQELLIKGNIPDVKIIPRPKFENATTSPSPAEDAAVWEAFLDLKRKTEGSVSRMTSFYEQVAKLQLTHEHEAAAYREVAESTISEQRKTIDTLSSDYTISVSNNESLQAILTKKTQQIMEYEKNTYDLNIRLKESEQKRAHLEDRATLAELGRKMAEIRQRELEMSLEHTTDLVKALRDHMSEFTRNKECALQEQYEMYEKNRRDVIDFYNEREKKVVQEFNETVKELQCIMTKAVNEREEYLSKCWREMMHTHQQQHDDAMREMILLRDKEEKDYQAKLIRMEQDKERWYDQYRNEMTLLEERHKERELHVLNDIARRERELGEREQRMRVQRSQEEQDAKVALMAKEAELKSYYQKITEDMRNDFDKERDKLTSSFRAQIQEISHLHLNNERELERMHRDKEREMAQRYRIAGYEVDDHKGEVALRGVSIQTEAALLSRFDAIEARQRERAEKARAALQSLPAGDSPPSDVGRL